MNIASYKPALTKFHKLDTQQEAHVGDSPEMGLKQIIADQQIPIGTSASDRTGTAASLARLCLLVLVANVILHTLLSSAEEKLHHSRETSCQYKRTKLDFSCL